MVLTGTLSSMSRSEAAEKIRAAGGSVTGRVTGNTDFLVAGENGGSKLEDAAALGVPVLDEAAFLALLGVTSLLSEAALPDRRPGVGLQQGELLF